MQMTLDILAEPCQAHPPLGQTVPTMVSASGCDWELGVSDAAGNIVEAAWIRNDPINRIDPDGMDDLQCNSGTQGTVQQPRLTVNIFRQLNGLPDLPQAPVPPVSPPPPAPLGPPGWFGPSLLTLLGIGSALSVDKDTLTSVGQAAIDGVDALFPHPPVPNYKPQPQLQAQPQPASDGAGARSGGRWRSTQTNNTRRNAEILRLNMGQNIRDAEQAHHIVQSTDRRAQAARDLLDYYQIDINSAENGVGLMKDVHQGSGLQTTATINWVFQELLSASRIGGDWTAQRQSIINKLRELAQLILEGKLDAGD